MSEIAYYFNGADGCDQCVAHSGFYLTNPEAGKPHTASCDCPIEEHEITEDMEGCRVEYRDISVSEGFSGGAVIPLEYNACGQENFTGTIDMGSGVTDEVGAELKTAAEEWGWTPPDHMDSFDFEAPDNTEGTIFAQLQLYEAEITAEKWLVCEFRDGTAEIHVEHMDGSYVCVEDVEFTYDSSPCVEGGQA